MEGRGQTMSSSRNPWGLEGKKERKWSDYNSEFDTPFGGFAHILMNWPGDLPTAEMDFDKRHNRLIETIAGYPRIAVGKRPLDFPMHYLSLEALKLSLYLDGIGIEGSKEGYEWHSLRTFLIDYDLKITTRLEPKVTDADHTMLLKTLIDNVKGFEEYEELNPEQRKTYDLEESNFLRGLHSSAHDRTRYWKNDNATKEITPPGFKFYGQVSGEAVERDGFFYEHSVKFLKIQKWIKFYAGSDLGGSTPLKLDIRHNLRIGASAILEGLFAKIRSKVLEEKRPGSITIDGGGRLCFISKNISEKIWIEEIISESFALEPRHPQPFAQILRKSIMEWGVETKRIPGEGLKQGETKAFLDEQFSQITEKYFPQMAINTPPDDSLEFEGFKHEQCHICTQSADGQTESTPKRYLSQFADEESSCSKNQVCAFHYLLFALGEGVKIRQASQRMKVVVNPKDQKIHHVICLDGNGIGQIFNKKWEEIENPKIAQISEKAPDIPSVNQAREKIQRDQEILDQLWSNQKEKITDLKTPWTEIEQALEQQCDDSLQNNAEVLEEIYKRRNQAYLQRKRRSFCFNAKWWIAFNDGIYSNPENHLEPFVAAGDDLILINRAQTEVQGTINALRDFARHLSEEFNDEIPISFGAGVAANTTTIAQTIKLALEAEESAKVRWKKFIQDVPETEHLIKEKARIGVQKRAGRLDLSKVEETLLHESKIQSIVHVWKPES